MMAAIVLILKIPNGIILGLCFIAAWSLKDLGLFQRNEILLSNLVMFSS